MHHLRNLQEKTPVIGNEVYIDPTAVVIGEVNLGDDVSVWPMAILRGDVNSIHIGKACNIQDAAILHVSHDGPYTNGGHPLILEESITVAHRVTLHGCHIESYCLIGIGAIILDGVHVEDHVMIAAGSLVPPGKILQKGHLYLGNPAKAVRLLTDPELENLHYSAKHYIKVKNKYLNP
jgi:carbonic anhydrase/acetyltransferase-like protein (isoleucine patch superfamily)